MNFTNLFTISYAILAPITIYYYNLSIFGFQTDHVLFIFGLSVIINYLETYCSAYFDVLTITFFFTVTMAIVVALKYIGYYAFGQSSIFPILATIGMTVVLELKYLEYNNGVTIFGRIVKYTAIIFTLLYSAGYIFGIIF